MSGTVRKFHGVFTGAAADITISKCPFQPRVIKTWATGGVWGLKIADQQGMDGANYLSSTAADVGLTITSTGFTIANGADANVNGELVYFECED